MTAFRILRSAPLTEKTSEVAYEDGPKLAYFHRVTRWPVLGTIHARTAEQALRIARETYGGRPVIEEIQGPIHYVG